MTVIYVRIPRNRWTRIGEIDLQGTRKHGPVYLDRYVEVAIQKARKLTEQTVRAEKQRNKSNRHFVGWLTLDEKRRDADVRRKLRLRRK